jgi:activating signal cointegrator complex subunit 1
MPPHSPPIRPTHFLCLPLATSASRAELETSLSLFLAHIAGPTPQTPAGIPAQVVRPPGTIHLTLGVMSLLTQDRIDGALSLLQTLDLTAMLADSRPAAVSNVVGPGIAVRGQKEDEHGNKQMVSSVATPGAPKPVGLRITLRGLVSMHDPVQTSILYAPPVDEDGSLYVFCNRLRSVFLDTGFLIPETRPLLLHASIVNTIYAQGGQRGGGRHGRKRTKMVIDARGLLETYKEKTWVNARLEKVAICRMGAQKIRDVHGRETGDEAYVIESEIEMP